MGEPCAGQVNANGSVETDSTACSLTLSDSFGLAVPIGSATGKESVPLPTITKMLGCRPDAMHVFFDSY